MPDILEFVHCTVPIELEINQLIDSLHIKDSNRMKILESCRWSDEGRIIVTHGTDTMVETATLLGKAHLPKTIVLTGAMVPYTVVDSDALFNLGASIAAVQFLQQGVYIVMNGRIFPWDNVRTNTEKGIFEYIHP